MSEKTKSILNSLFKFLLAGALIGWLVGTGKLDLNSASAIFRDPFYFAVGFLLLGANLWLASERWRVLATPQNVPAGPFEVFRLTLIGVFFNYAMPGGVGGDVIKAYYFGKDHPQAKAAAITSVILDRVLGLYAMIGMALVAMLVDFKHVMTIPMLQSLFVLLLVLAFGFSLAFLSLFSRRIKSQGWMEKILQKLPFSAKFMKLYLTAHQFGLLRGRVLIVLGLSVVAQSFSILFLFVAGYAAGFTDVSLMTFFLVAPLGYMATAIPISPAGLGVGQAAFFLLFNLYLGRESGLGSVVITSQQVMTLLFGLLGAFYYVRRRSRPGAEKEQLDQIALPEDP